MKECKRIRSTLNKSIKTICQSPNKYCRNPEKDFTRRKKLPMEKVMNTIFISSINTINISIIILLYGFCDTLQKKLQRVSAVAGSLIGQITLLL